MQGDERQLAEDRLAEAHELIGKWQAHLAPGRKSITLNISSLRKVCEELEALLVAAPEAGEEE